MQKKSISINRFFLGMMVWVIAAPFFLVRFFMNFTLGQSLVASQLLFLIPVFLYIAVKRIRIREWVPFEKISIPTILRSALFGLLLLPLVTCINIFSMFFVTNHVAETSTEIVQMPLWASLLLMALMPAVSEEFIFRGIFYHAYREKGVLMGALGCGVVFGLAHMNFNQFCYAFVLGVAFCFLVEATGSIFSSMTAHFVINGWNMLLLQLTKPLEELAGSAGQAAAETQTLEGQQLLLLLAVYGVMALVATALAIGVLIWTAKRCGRAEHMSWCVTRIKKSPGEKRSFVTPCWIAAALICAVYMILQEMLL